MYTSRDVIITVAISSDITESYIGRCGLDCVFHALYTSRDVVITVAISFDITESYIGRCGLDCVFHVLYTSRDVVITVVISFDSVEFRSESKASFKLSHRVFARLPPSLSGTALIRRSSVAVAMVTAASRRWCSVSTATFSAGSVWRVTRVNVCLVRER